MPKVITVPLFCYGQSQSGRKHLMQQHFKNSRLIIKQDQFRIYVDTIFVNSLDKIPKDIFAVLFAYSTLKTDQFTQIQKYLELKHNNFQYISLIGTHRDKKRDRQVSLKQGNQIKKQYNLYWMETGLLENQQQFITLFQKHLIIKLLNHFQFSNANIPRVPVNVYTGQIKLLSDDIDKQFRKKVCLITFERHEYDNNSFLQADQMEQMTKAVKLQYQEKPLTFENLDQELGLTKILNSQELKYSRELIEQEDMQLLQGSAIKIPQKQNVSLDFPLDTLSKHHSVVHVQPPSEDDDLMSKKVQEEELLALQQQMFKQQVEQLQNNIAEQKIKEREEQLLKRELQMAEEQKIIQLQQQLLQDQEHKLQKQKANLDVERAKSQLLMNIQKQSSIMGSPIVNQREDDNISEIKADLSSHFQEANNQVQTKPYVRSDPVLENLQKRLQNLKESTQNLDQNDDHQPDELNTQDLQTNSKLKQSQYQDQPEVDLSHQIVSPHRNISPYQYSGQLKSQSPVRLQDIINQNALVNTQTLIDINKTIQKPANFTHTQTLPPSVIKAFKVSPNKKVYDKQLEHAEFFYERLRKPDIVQMQEPILIIDVTIEQSHFHLKVFNLKDPPEYIVKEFLLENKLSIKRFRKLVQVVAEQIDKLVNISAQLLFEIELEISNQQFRIQVFEHQNSQQIAQQFCQRFGFMSAYDKILQVIEDRTELFFAQFGM